MYQALYRKYRPATFSDVCGQDHITSVLKTQLQKGKTSHAYLFCGSRGTGKTSCAKILAKAVNCENPRDGEPCNECDTCRAINEDRILDVVEMDAASNNGVDNIRRLCDEVQYLPSEAKKRVYIIDEVHMLSTSAFNALLKTIEEPPEHVLFILATTEVNDIPATILSRCQRFDFKRLHPQVIIDRLMTVAAKEQIPLDRSGAAVLARLSDGAMRDALSLLEACQGYSGELNGETVPELLGLGSRESVLALCRAIAEGNHTRVLHLIRTAYERMSDLKELIGEVLSVYRDLLVFKTVSGAREFVEAYESEFQELESIAALLPLETLIYQSEELEDFYAGYDRIASEKKASVELLFLRLCSPRLSGRPEALEARLSALEQKYDRLSAGAVLPSAAPSPAPERETVPAAPEAPAPVPQAPQKTPAGAYPYAMKLKNALQNENQLLRSFLGEVEMVQEGSRLRIMAPPFSLGVIRTVGGEDLILKTARELSPEIREVTLEPKQETSSESSSSLDDF